MLVVMEINLSTGNIVRPFFERENSQHYFSSLVLQLRSLLMILLLINDFFMVVDNNQIFLDLLVLL